MIKFSSRQRTVDSYASLCVCLSGFVLCCALPQWYKTMLCTTDLHCAPWRTMHLHKMILHVRDGAKYNVVSLAVCPCVCLSGHARIRSARQSWLVASLRGHWQVCSLQRQVASLQPPNWSFDLIVPSDIDRPLLKYWIEELLTISGQTNQVFLRPWTMALLRNKRHSGDRKLPRDVPGQRTEHAFLTVNVSYDCD